MDHDCRCDGFCGQYPDGPGCVSDESLLDGKHPVPSPCLHSAQDWYIETATGRRGCNECDEAANV